MGTRQLTFIIIVLLCVGVSNLTTEAVPNITSNNRKEIVLHKKNIQAQLKCANVAYIVKNDFDLNGEKLMFPENCTLRFQGGCIKNGIIVGNQTKIENGELNSFKYPIVIEGTWDGICHPEWYGAHGDGISDDTYSIQRALDSFGNVEFRQATYVIRADAIDGIVTDYTDDGSCAILIKRNAVLTGNHTIIKTYHTDKAYTQSKNYYAFVCMGSLYVKGITIDGQYSTYRGTYGIQLRNSDNKIENCVFKNLGSSGLVFNGEYGKPLRNNVVKDILLENCGNSIFCVFVEDSFFDDITMRHVSEGFDFDKLCSNISITHIVFDGLRGKGADAAVEINGGHNMMVSDCDIDGAKIGILINGKPRKDRVGLPVDTKSYQISVKDCQIRNTVGYGVVLGSTFYREYHSYDQKDIRFDNVNVVNSGLQGFHLTGENVVLTSCSAVNCKKEAIFVNNYNKDILVKNFHNGCERLIYEEGGNANIIFKNISSDY